MKRRDLLHLFCTAGVLASFLPISQPDLTVPDTARHCVFVFWDAGAWWATEMCIRSGDVGSTTVILPVGDTGLDKDQVHVARITAGPSLLEAMKDPESIVNDVRRKAA